MKHFSIKNNHCTFVPFLAHFIEIQATYEQTIIYSPSTNLPVPSHSQISPNLFNNNYYFSLFGDCHYLPLLHVHLPQDKVPPPLQK